MTNKNPKLLYVSTTEGDFKKGIVKVGEALSGRVEKRMREHSTGRVEKTTVLWTAPLNNGLTDKKVGRELENQGAEHLKKGGGTEFYKASVDDVKRAYNALVNGVPRAHSYSLRNEQKRAVDKAEKWFTKGFSSIVYGSATHKNRFLLNAKMRFGKCFTSIHIAKRLKSKSTLVITYKPEVLTEWMEAVNDHLDFNGWQGIRAKKSNNPREPFIDFKGNIPKTTDNKVICVSLQDLWIDENHKTKKRLSKLLKTEWDLVIFDEVHFGSLTDRAQGILEKLTYKKRLDLSGTPFRLLEMEDFCKEQIYTYSYLDEQKLKSDEVKTATKKDRPIYRVFPSLNVSTIEITEDDIQKQLDQFWNNDNEFSLNKLFEVKSGKFANLQAVNHFIEGLSRKTNDATAISVYGANATKLNIPSKRHSVWWVNSVATARALAKLLNKHHFFKHFEIINAAGMDKSDEALADITIARERDHVKSAINRSIKEKTSNGTITITVKRFLTGVTIKEWDSILVLNDISSPEEYYQAIFRIQSPWQDDLTHKVLKPEAWIFDFSITRCLKMKFHYADAIACERIRERKLHNSTTDELRKVADELCDATSLTRYFEGKLTPDKTTADHIFEVVSFGSSRTSLARRITSDALVNFVPLKDLKSNPKLYAILKNIKGYRTQDVGTIGTLVRIGKQAEKRFEKNRTQKPGDDEKEKNNADFMKKKEMARQKKWVATQIKRLAISIADFIYMTKFREFSIDHVIKTKEPVFFKAMTGISKDDFEKLCRVGFINKQKLNEIVREFRMQEETSLKPEEFIMDNLDKLVA